jgi:transcriptional repressor NrdR
MLDILIVKSDGHREAFSRDKMVAGLKKALDKRSYTNEQFHNIVQKIERDIRKKRANEVTSKQLGDIAMKHLKRFDKVAYIRFASVYHSFEGLDKFEEELKKLNKKR